MPEYLYDPSVLTKDRLKSELVAHSVSLPVGDQRKDVYVQLYLKHLTARNHLPHRGTDFSSDEEDGAAPVPAPGRTHRKATRKTDKADKASVEENNVTDVTQLTDENLRDQLTKYGYSVGPIVATTRKVYEKKLEQLMDQSSAATEEKQPNGSTDSDQYSDTEEEVMVMKELFPSKTKTHVVTRQRKADYNRVEQNEMVKDILVEEIIPNQTSTPTGISATCRKPIRGAAGRPVEFTYRDALPRRPVPKVQPLAQVKPEKSKSQRSVPIWIQIAVLLIVAFFLFLVYQAMETNQVNPFLVDPDHPKQIAESQ